jgi:hypothetical protein
VRPPQGGESSSSADWAHQGPVIREPSHIAGKGRQADALSSPGSCLCSLSRPDGSLAWHERDSSAFGAERYLARERIRQAHSDPDLPRLLWILMNGLTHGVPVAVMRAVPARSVGSAVRLVPFHDEPRP